MKNKKLINILGLLGIVSFLSYLCANIFAPLAYPGYNWLQQACSDLSADGAPSLKLWDSISAFHKAFSLLTMVIATLVASSSNHNKLLKLGIYLFTAMTLISNVGYTMFPLSEAGYAGTFQDIMHVYVITMLVVLLSISSLILCIIGGHKKNGSKLLFVSAIICFSMMMIGAISATPIIPKAVFGIFERFSTMSATAFTAIVGVWVYRSKVEIKTEIVQKTCEENN